MTKRSHNALARQQYESAFYRARIVELRAAGESVASIASDVEKPEGYVRMILRQEQPELELRGVAR